MLGSMTRIPSVKVLEQRQKHLGLMSAPDGPGGCQAGAGVCVCTLWQTRGDAPVVWWGPGLPGRGCRGRALIMHEGRVIALAGWCWTSISSYHL